MNKVIKQFLTSRGAKIVRFVDISHLNGDDTLNYTTAIVFIIPFSVDYIQEVYSNPNYVSDMLRNKMIDQDEFHHTEMKTDRLGDELADYLKNIGYKSYSQSEKNIEETKRYNQTEYRTPLPHKTIALMAGLGWIGKHNLLINPQFGSAFSMCTVLTNVELETINYQPLASKCGDCRICVERCVPGALLNTNWNSHADRDDIVNITKCTTCIQCMMACPWTQKYASS